MSDAIVAKAVNDTIGTPQFKGLNSILDEHLNKLDVVLKENIAGIKDAVLPVSNLSNPIYSYDSSRDTIPFASVRKVDSEGTSKKIRLGYSGLVLVKCKDFDVTNVSFNNATYIGNFVTSNTELGDSLAIQSGAFLINAGAEFWFSAQGTMFIYGHTEFAPPIQLEII